ncbi:MAG: hypothetical protein E4H26_12340 [Flavobacteriales bacterium]|nr:MAG: hypothetical protein E4H26_12340 [Flavobacteriales bacterium]
MNLNKMLRLLLCGLMIMVMGCSQSKYDQLVKAEMAKGIVNDSLMLGMKLGQTQKEFFDKCWKLNRDKIVTNGADGFVAYELPSKNGESIGNEVTMLFYGIFNEEKVMTGMNFQFYHGAWSLWNKSLQSDQLINVVKERFMEWYPGNDFISVSLKNKEGELFVKVDGIRRITIKPLDDNRLVKAQIDDLRYVLSK